VNKLKFRPFQEALSDINLVSEKDVDIRMIEAILSRSRFLPENPHMFQLELLSRFSRAPGANSPVIGRMVAEAAAMVLVKSEQCIVPFYPCVSPSSGGVRRHTRYAPTHVLAVTTEKLHRKGQQREDEEEKEGKSSDDSATVAVVWGERCGLQVWRTSRDDDTFQFYYHVCNQVQSTLSHCSVGGVNKNFL